MPEVDRPERRDRIDEQQRRVLGVIYGAANLGQARRDACRCLVVYDEDGFDSMVAVVAIGGQAPAQLRGVNAAPPIAWNDLDVEPEPSSDFRPVLSERARIE